MILNKISDDIWIWEEFFKSPESIVQYFLDNNEWTPFYNQAMELKGTKTQIGPKQEHPYSEMIKYELFKCLKQYLDSHGKNIDDYDFNGNLTNIISYAPGWYTGPHTDFSYNAPEDGGEVKAIPFTICIYYNDNYIGGEFAFPDHGFKEKMKPGSMVIFDQYTVHDAYPLVSGPRYMSMIPVMKKTWA